jgi:hypothetical protein
MLGISGLAVVGAAAVVALLFARMPHPNVVDTEIEGAPVVPRGVVHWVRLRILNNELEPAPGPFQQQLLVDSSRYSHVEAANLQNVEFFGQRGEVLPSWLESGNSNLAKHTIYWIKLKNGLPPGKMVSVYMGFAEKDQELLDGVASGEAAGLSPQYGAYDNGAQIFARYANFAGTSLPAGWHDDVTPGGEGLVRVGNGVLISHEGRGGGSASLVSDWLVGGDVAEMHLLTQQTVNGQEMILVCSESPNAFRWAPYSVGYQNMSGLEIESNHGGSPSVLAQARPNPTQTAIIGFQGSTLFANYQVVAQVQPRICGGNYLAASVNTGKYASFSFDWIRMRGQPPAGVMPTTSFGKLQ